MTDDAGYLSGWFQEATCFSSFVLHRKMCPDQWAVGEKAFTTITPTTISARPMTVGVFKAWPMKSQLTSVMSTTPTPDQIA